MSYEGVVAANAVMYAGANGTLDADVTKLSFIESTTRFGVGVAVPLARLHVEENGGGLLVWSTSGSEMALTLAGQALSTDYNVKSHLSTQQLDINRGGSAAIAFRQQNRALAQMIMLGGDSVGNVGIGTNTPSAAFHVVQQSRQAGANPNGAVTAFRVTAGAHTDLPASTEAPDITLDLTRTARFATGAVGTQRAIIVGAPTYSAIAPSTFSFVSLLYLGGAPISGNNATFIFASALQVDAGTPNNADFSFGISGVAQGIANGVGAITGRGWIATVGDTIPLGDQTATLTEYAQVYLGQDTLESSTNVRTVTNPNTLKIAGAPLAGTNVAFTNPANSLHVETGYSRFSDGLRIDEGSNKSMGVATLVGGTVTVNNTTVAANSRIFLSGQNTSGTAGELTISARIAGTSFTVASTSGTDTRQIAWWVISP